jgi:hypothetical protein
VVIRDGDDGWTVEASVDLEALGVDPDRQTELGFNVRLVDYDEGEEAARRLSWSRADRLGGREGGDAANLGRIRLEPGPPLR